MRSLYLIPRALFLLVCLFGHSSYGNDGKGTSFDDRTVKLRFSALSGNLNYVGTYGTANLTTSAQRNNQGVKLEIEKLPGASAGDGAPSSSFFFDYERWLGGSVKGSALGYTSGGFSSTWMPFGKAPHFMPSFSSDPSARQAGKGRENEFFVFAGPHYQDLIEVRAVTTTIFEKVNPKAIGARGGARLVVGISKNLALEGSGYWSLPLYIFGVTGARTVILDSRTYSWTGMLDYRITNAFSVGAGYTRHMGRLVYKLKEGGSQVVEYNRTQNLGASLQFRF